MDETWKAPGEVRDRGNKLNELSDSQTSALKKSQRNPDGTVASQIISLAKMNGATTRTEDLNCPRSQLGI